MLTLPVSKRAGIYAVAVAKDHKRWEPANATSIQRHASCVLPINLQFVGCVRIWNTLTDNYGNVMPVDWKTSHTRSLHLPTLNLMEKGKIDSVNLDLSDDEELREQLDMHSIIVSCINDEPLFTAEQVCLSQPFSRDYQLFR
ncbi:FEZ2 protein, partial [Polyodon spathula]|nr:FEZ2 protein [Polyodon spathula]